MFNKRMRVGGAKQDGQRKHEWADLNLEDEEINKIDT